MLKPGRHNLNKTDKTLHNNIKTLKYSAFKKWYGFPHQKSNEPIKYIRWQMKFAKFLNQNYVVKLDHAV
jgi:hypothetical protein